MAQRAPGKAKRASQRASTDVAGAGGSAAAAREVERLRAELETARAEIAELLRQREQLANRIDWIINSLHSLLEEQR